MYSIIANNTAVSSPDWDGDYLSGGNNIIGVGSGSFPTTTGDQTRRAAATDSVSSCFGRWSPAKKV